VTLILKFNNRFGNSICARYCYSLGTYRSITPQYVQPLAWEIATCGYIMVTTFYQYRKQNVYKNLLHNIHHEWRGRVNSNFCIKLTYLYLWSIFVTISRIRCAILGTIPPVLWLYLETQFFLQCCIYIYLQYPCIALW
jgi:hypothetical protein